MTLNSTIFGAVANSDNVVDQNYQCVGTIAVTQFPNAYYTVTVTDSNGNQLFTEPPQLAPRTLFSVSCSDLYPQIPPPQQVPLTRQIDVQDLTASSDATITLTVSGCNDLNPDGDSSYIQAWMSYSAAPPSFNFDMTTAVNGDEKQARILTHIYQPGDTFFSQFQLDDADKIPPNAPRPQMKIDGTVINPPSNNQMWFKIIDPPDPSPYVPAVDSHANDNRDPQPPILWTGDGQQHVSVNQPLQVSWDASNAVHLVLEGSDHVSGDNYQVLASFDPPDASGNFPCEATAACDSSPVITVWKREYVEVHSMFRSGSWLTEPIAAGDLDIFVSDVGSFANGVTVIIEHAPNSSSDVFHAEFHKISVIPNDRVHGIPAHLHLTDGPAGASYLVNESTVDNSGDYFLSDAVGVASSLTPYAGDYYVPVFGSPDPITGLTPVQAYFATMYVDLEIVPATLPPVPFWENVPFFTPQSLEFGVHWSDYLDAYGIPVVPGHCVLIGASQPDSAGNLGDTEPPSTFTLSYSFIGEIEHGVHDVRYQINGQDPELVALRNCAHELTHQWKVNMNPVPPGGDGVGHCAYDDYADSSRFCLMHEPWTDSAHDHELGEDILRLHYAGSGANADSEYLQVREAPEPP